MRNASHAEGASVSMPGSNDSLANVGVFVAAVVALPLVLLFATFLRYFHASRCDPAAYLVSGWNAGPSTAALVAFACAFGVCALFTIMSAAARFDVGLKRRRNRSALAVLLGVPVAIWGVSALLFDQSCLSDKGAELQTAPWARMHHYDWTAADKVTVACKQAKGGWAQQASIDFDHGLTVNFPARSNDGTWFAVYRRATSHLHGRSVTLDTLAVDPSCPQPERELLVRLP